MGKEKVAKQLTRDELIKEFNKKFKGKVIGRASTDRSLTDQKWLGTGIFAVDYATGGGVPIGRITGFYGRKSCGKTSLALRAIAASQHYCKKCQEPMTELPRKLYRCLGCGFRGEKEGELCPDCKETLDKEGKPVQSPLVDAGDHAFECPTCKTYEPMETMYLDAEGTWDNRWAAANGVNCHYVFVASVECAEQAGDIAGQMLRCGECDLMVIDTIAHLTPSIEIQETLEKMQMGIQARLTNKILRMIMSALQHAKERKPTVIILNQVRLKIGMMYGDPETKPGGMGQEFVTSVDLKLWSGKYEKDTAGNTLNVVLNFRVVKNKCGVAQQGGNFRLWLRSVTTEDNRVHRVGDTDEREVVLGYALKQGLFGESPKWNYAGEKFKNQDEVVQFVLSNPPVYDKVRTQLMSGLLGTIASDDEALELPDPDGD